MDTTRHIEDTIEIEDIAFGEEYVDLVVEFELDSERGQFHFYEGLEFKVFIKGTDKDITDELSKESRDKVIEECYQYADEDQFDYGY